jgi:RecA-family ATPase
MTDKVINMEAKKADVIDKLNSKLIETSDTIATEESIWNRPLNLPNLVDAEPLPLKWFIKDRIVAGRGVVVSGIGGSSKTRYVIHLAVGACLGKLPWDWEVAQTGRAILVLTEDTADEFHRLIHNMCLSSELTRADKIKLYDRLIVYPLAGKQSILLQKDKHGNLEPSQLFNDLVTTIQKQEDIVFIGLDPALSLTDGEEIDQSHQRRLGKMADDLAVKTGSTVMLVAHAAKNLKEEITSHNSRGGGALVDAVRGEFVMRNMTKKEAHNAKVSAEDRPRIVQLVGVKGNMLPPSAYIPVWLQRDQYGNLEATDIEFNPDDTNCIGTKEKKAHEVLIEICKDGVKPKLKQWMEALIEINTIKKTKKQKAQEKEMHDIRKRLFEAGMIKKDGHGIWIPEVEDEGRDFDFND